MTAANNLINITGSEKPAEGYNEMLDLHGKINKQLFTNQDLDGVTYRTINHWASKDLFLEPKELEHNWRKFSFVEYIWIRMLVALREMGAGLDFCLKVKKQLLSPFKFDQLLLVEDLDLSERQKKLLNDRQAAANEELNPEIIKTLSTEGEIKVLQKTNMLTMGIIEIIQQKLVLNYLLFMDGEVVPIIYDKIADLEHRGIEEHTKHHYSISLNELMKDFIKKDSSLYKTKYFELLSEPEAKILELARNKRVHKIEVVKKNEEVDEISFKEKLNGEGEGRLVDYLLKSGYQKLSAAIENGKVVYLERTTKLKYNKKPQLNKRTK